MELCNLDWLEIRCGFGIFIHSASLWLQSWYLSTHFVFVSPMLTGDTKQVPWHWHWIPRWTLMKVRRGVNDLSKLSRNICRLERLQKSEGVWKTCNQMPDGILKIRKTATKSQKVWKTFNQYQKECCRWERLQPKIWKGCERPIIKCNVCGLVRLQAKVRRCENHNN